MRVLLVGLGRWGDKHLRVLGELGAEVWVAEPDEAARRRALGAGVLPAQVVSDYREALPHVEAVDVVTPADSHLDIGRAALEAGRDCFVEKPLTRTVAEGEALRDVARRTGRLVQVGHVFRFHPVTAVLRAELDRGTLGAVRYCAGRFAGFKRPRLDVGVTQTDAIHYFDLFAHLLGRPATAVTATQRDFLGRGLDDLSVTTVEYGAVPAFIEAGYFAPGTQRDCVIVGERATLQADFGTAEVHVHENRHVREPGGAWLAPEGRTRVIKASGPEPLRQEIEEFLEAVACRHEPAVDVEAGLAALRVVEAAAESARQGRRVSIRP